MTNVWHHKTPIEDVGEPYEKTYSPKEQAERDEWYAENKKILRELRHHLDQSDHFMRMAEQYLEGIESDNDPDNLQEAFEQLAASEKSNEDLL